MQFTQLKIRIEMKKLIDAIITKWFCLHKWQIISQTDFYTLDDNVINTILYVSFKAQFIVVVSLKHRDYFCHEIVSHHFGYGLMDAAAMVMHAENWTTVPVQHRCQIAAVLESR